jgi:DNA polymerase-3 subunit gamma/tau
LRELDALAKTGKDLGRLLSDLLRHFRNLMIYQVSSGDLNLLEASEAEIGALSEQSKSLTTAALARIMEVFSGCELNYRDAASKKILIEIALLRAIEARNAVSLDAVLRQLQQLRSGNPPGAAPAAPAAPAPAKAPGFLRTAVAALESQKPAPPATPPQASSTMALAETPAVQPTAPRPMAPAGPENQGMPPEALELLWAKLVEAAQRASPFLRSYLLEAHPASFAGNVFTIGFDPEFSDHASLVDNAKNHTLLQTKLHELGHSGVQIKFIVAEAPPGRKPAVLTNGAKASETAPAPAANGAKPKAKTKAGAADIAEFKNDPLIQHALEIFRGTIAEVRI